MKHRNSHFAVGYWSRIRQGRPAPDQADIDPKALKRLLPFVFLLDAQPGGSFIYRLAGTTLCERYGGELRGRNYLSHWDADSSERLKVLLRQALTMRVPLCVTSIGVTEDCRMVEIETLLMPITFGAGEPERFLATAQVLGDISPLGGRPLTFERLVAASLVRENESADDAEPPPPPPPPVECADGRSHPRAAHLRLVVSRRDALEPAADPLHFDAGATLRKFIAFCGDAVSRRAQT